MPRLTAERAAFIRRGLAAYTHEQEVLLRLIRKLGGLTESKFDELFLGRGMRRPTPPRPISGDSYLLGGLLQCEWSRHLELLQYMVSLGDVTTTRDADGELIYLSGG